MLLLGIETSCDETSAAVVEYGRRVLSCVISSSKTDFKDLGGVIPENAARKQLQSILPVVELALSKAGLSTDEIDAVAVTYGPGLLGSLLVGTCTARVLANIFRKPLIPVHHTLGHLSSTWLSASPSDDKPQFPLLTLSVSGGHTDLWYRTRHTEGMLIGATRDDAAGEAFDKGATLLGLPYPGGPALAKLADTGDETAHDFPHPLRQEDTLDFSFSGLKTSLKYLLRDLGPQAMEDSARRSIAASYQFAICRHLIERLRTALRRYPDAKEIHVVGGVSANARLRAMLQDLAKVESIVSRVPERLPYCTDNAAMIASAGYFLLQEHGNEAVKPFTTLATSDLGELLLLA